jgi:hypothetical protein
MSEDTPTGGVEYTTVRCCRRKSGSFSSCCRLRHVTLDTPPIVAAAGSGLGGSYSASVTPAPSPATSKGVTAVPLVADALLLVWSPHGGVVVSNREEEDWDFDAIAKDGDVPSTVPSGASLLFVATRALSSAVSLKIRALASAYAFSNSVRLPRLGNAVVVVVVPDVDDNESCCGNNRETALLFLKLLLLLLI